MWCGRDARPQRRAASARPAERALARAFAAAGGSVFLLAVQYRAASLGPLAVSGTLAGAILRCLRALSPNPESRIRLWYEVTPWLSGS